MSVPARRLRHGKNKVQGPQNRRYNRPKNSNDWTPSGYNYMGPGNVLDDAPAQDIADEYAHLHDTQYGEYEANTGNNPKFAFIAGIDDIFEENMNRVREEALPNEVAYQIFRAKRKLAEFGAIPYRYHHPVSKALTYHQLWHEPSSHSKMTEGTHFIS